MCYPILLSFEGTERWAASRASRPNTVEQSKTFQHSPVAELLLYGAPDTNRETWAEFQMSQPSVWIFISVWWLGFAFMKTVKESEDFQNALYRLRSWLQKKTVYTLITSQFSSTSKSLHFRGTHYILHFLLLGWFTLWIHYSLKFTKFCVML